MQFLVVARDGADEQALARRMAAREAHLKRVDEMRHRGEILYAVAMLNEQEKMIGSTVVYDCPSRAVLDAWLRDEPYVIGGVWRRVEVFPCRVPPGFAKS